MLPHPKYQHHTLKIHPRALGIAFLVLLLGAAPAAANTLHLEGYLAARGIGVRSQPSWLDGGFGRLAQGAETPDDDATHGLAKADVGLTWEPSPRFRTYFQVAARAEPERQEGESLGFIEAYVEGNIPLRRSDTLRLRLGHFILPTTKEAVDVAWSTPYTITLSALNSWIGEEVRPTGLLADYTLALGTQDALRLGASVFGGNDTAGTLIGWRGWALGDRLTVFGETLPLPPLASLADPTRFGLQSDDGTQPFGSDLDGRAGWTASLGWQRPERASIQYTRYDNRGDRDLHGDEYAWSTQFHLLGAELHLGEHWSYVGEAMDGQTRMGFLTVTGAKVAADFEAAYLLASWRTERFRATLRYDRFEATERDGSRGENNDDDGDGWTAAFFWEPGNWRLGVELLDLEAERPAAAESGFDPDNGGRSAILELRYFLGS